MVGTLFAMVAAAYPADRDTFVAMKSVLSGAGFGIGPLLGLIAAALGVAGGGLAFRNRHNVVAALVIASAAEFFAWLLDVPNPFPVTGATVGAFALLIGAAALAGVAATVAKLRQGGLLDGSDLITD